MTYQKKRYKSVECVASATGHAILLDGKPALTPLGEPYDLKNLALAKAIAAEWQKQKEFIEPLTMPLTRMAATLLDLTEQRREKRMSELLEYAETELVCYRAGEIPELAQEQSRKLDPILGWAEERFGIGLKVADGVMPVRQPESNRIRLAAHVCEYNAARFTGLVAAVGPLGSLLLALALVEGRLTAKEAFELSHLEEQYETRKWGADEEKEARLAALKKEVEDVQDFLSLALSSPNIL